MYIHMYACTFICMYIYMYVHLYACTFICMYIYMHVHLYACTFICMYIYMHVHLYACTFICMYIYIHVNPYVCMYTLSNSTNVSYNSKNLLRNKYYSARLSNKTNIPLSLLWKTLYIHSPLKRQCCT
jgi:hypothetical protein